MITWILISRTWCFAPNLCLDPYSPMRVGKSLILCVRACVCACTHVKEGGGIRGDGEMSTPPWGVQGRSPRAWDTLYWKTRGIIFTVLDIPSSYGTPKYSTNIKSGMEHYWAGTKLQPEPGWFGRHRENLGLPWRLAIVQICSSGFTNLTINHLHLM